MKVSDLSWTLQRTEVAGQTVTLPPLKSHANPESELVFAYLGQKLLEVQLLENKQTSVRVGNVWHSTDLSSPRSLNLPSGNAAQLEFKEHLLMILMKGVEDSPCETQEVTPLIKKCLLPRLTIFVRKRTPARGKDTPSYLGPLHPFCLTLWGENPTSSLYQQTEKTTARVWNSFGGLQKFFPFHLTTSPTKWQYSNSGLWVKMTQSLQGAMDREPQRPEERQVYFGTQIYSNSYL